MGTCVCNSFFPLFLPTKMNLFRICFLVPIKELFFLKKIVLWLENKLQNFGKDLFCRNIGVSVRKWVLNIGENLFVWPSSCSDSRKILQVWYPPLQYKWQLPCIYILARSMVFQGRFGSSVLKFLKSSNVL